MGMVTLVFPSSMQEALQYNQAAQAHGETIIAASSVVADETAKHYAQWSYLPSIYHDGFVEALCALVARFSITHMYTPHAVVHRAMQEVIAEHRLALVLHASPIETLNAHYAGLLARADDALPFIRAIAPTSLSTHAVASLFHYAEHIYGQSSESKIAALAAALSCAPKGDVIEIGTAWGRSAFALAFLARHLEVGNVLAIDPWDVVMAHQARSPEVLNAVSRDLDWAMMFHIFLIHLLPMRGCFNYRRGLSREAEQHYRTHAHWHSAEFGDTAYQQRVALIHIDGNHDADAVAEDVALWHPYILPGGWLVLDDYVWAHGDGPRIAGDCLLAQEAHTIAQAFTCGNALFIQFSEDT